MTAAIVYSTKLESTTAAGSFTLTGLTIAPGTNQRLLVFPETARAAGNTPARTITSVVWNAINLNSLIQATSATGTGGRIAAFDAALGSTGGTSNLVITYNNTTQGCILHVFVVEDAEQGTPTPTAISSNNLSDAISLSGVGIAIDGLMNDSNNTASNFSLTAATQTQTAQSPSRVAAGLVNEQNLGTSYAMGSGSKTFGWTATNSSNRAHIIVGYLQASGGTTPVNTSFAPAGTSTAAFAAKARALRSATMAGTSTMAVVARARAASTVAMPGSGAMTISAVARKAVVSTMPGTSALSVGALARISASFSATGSSAMSVIAASRASVTMTFAGVGSMSVAASARAATALTIAGTSTMAIIIEGDFTAIPSRTFTQSRDRVYRGGRDRVFSATGRERVFR